MSRRSGSCSALTRRDEYRPVAAGSPEARRLQGNLVNAFSEDLIAQYITSIQNDLGATINEAALNQVIGGSTN